MPNSLLSTFVPLPSDWSKSKNGSDAFMHGFGDVEKSQNCNIFSFVFSDLSENNKLLPWSVWQKSKLVIKQGDSTCK